MGDPRIRQRGIKLLVAGEFYEDEQAYQTIIDQHQVRDLLIMRTAFIPDRDVRYYLCAADVVVQPYRNATQSGVTPLAYHFEKPMVVTNVGGLPDMVPDMKSGIVTEPNPASIADGILRFYDIGEEYFIPHLRTEKEKYAWPRLIDTIRHLAGINT
jgi:glycosyltransferase involved in cell wall biosynthesis